MDKETGLDLGDLSSFLVTHSMHLVTEFNSQASRAAGHSEAEERDPQEEGGSVGVGSLGMGALGGPGRSHEIPTPADIT